MKKEEIQHLAKLSRIEISDDEAQKYTEDFDKILAYVDKIKELNKESSDDITIGNSSNVNVFRNDDDVQETGKYTENILKEAPDTHEGFIKVKKILNND